MAHYWSDYIQTTEELYASRDNRFHESNKEIWMQQIGVSSGMKVLEVGCAGGTFCHKLKEYIPDLDITGLDKDKDHIAFAIRKAEELGLDVKFVEGDIGNLPFADETFDLVFSYTVAEHVPPDDFYKEQQRVLKPGGRMTVLSVRTGLSLKDREDENISDEEMALMEKLWSGAEPIFEKYGVGKYEMEEHEFPRKLAEYGFRQVDVQIFSLMEYSPDSASVSDEEAIRQIENRRIMSLNQMKKGMRLAPGILSEHEAEELACRINRRFDRRVEKYKRGIALWDFASSTVLAVSGRKMWKEQGIW